MTPSIAGLVSLFLGPFTAPPVLVATVLLIVLVVLVGRVLVGVAWRLVLVALAVVVGLWILGTPGPLPIG